MSERLKALNEVLDGIHREMEYRLRVTDSITDPLVEVAGYVRAMIKAEEIAMLDKKPKGGDDE